MQLYELAQAYEHNRGVAYQSINQLLDFYQQKYISGDIDITTYQEVFHVLHEQGATSSHDYAFQQI
ncbi:YppF family protein [Lentibacillus sp. N15]|uniref:YppF family protein n=1 Tax=Lentibacillus songyuanensis TaxID=3136161 RepID=UPI0031BAA1B7